MSQYYSFYIRTADKKFYPICTYGASSGIGEAFYCPYEKMRVLKHKDFVEARDALKEEINKLKKVIEDHELSIKYVSEAVGPMEDKIDYIHDMLDLNNEAKESIDECTELLARVSMLDDMNEEFRYETYNDANLYDNYIYLGFEINSDEVSEEDIVC